jgi:hypothetical protein
MLPSLDWNFINGVSGLLTAIGTLSAVIVSLWLALRDTRIRLRVNVGIRKILLEGKAYDRVSQEPEFLIVTVTNIGRRVVTVRGLLWKNRLIRRRFVFQMPGEAPLSAQFPTKLQDGEQASFSVRLGAWASENDFADHIKRLIPKPGWLTIRFLRMLVRTSTGELVSAPIEKELRQWLLAFSQGKPLDDLSARAKTERGPRR